MKKPIVPRRANLHAIGKAGDFCNTEDRAARRLARAIHASESTSCVTSWPAQERAEKFFNTYGLGKTLDECNRLEALRLPDADN